MIWLGDEWSTRGWGRVLLAWMLFQLDWAYWNVWRPFQEWRQIRAYRKALSKPPHG
jgi:hypothetical protein